MRILFATVYPHLPEIVGGLQTTTDDLCIALQDAGAEVAVLCGTTNAGAGQGLPAVRRDDSFSYSVIRAIDPIEALGPVAAAWDASVIVVQTGTTLLPLIAKALESGRPTVVYLHNVESYQLGGNLEPDPRLVYLSNSAFAARRWQVLYGIDSVVIPPLVLPERYIVASEGMHVLYVNPVPIKGVEILFRLAEVCPDIPFIVAESWGLDSRWRERCRRRAAALGNIEWSLPVRDMRPIFRRTRTLLMPSVWEETFGRTALEAQISGIPVVASTRGALPETVGAGGILVDPHAPISEWETSLRQAYAPSQEYDRLVQAARENAYATAVAPLIVGRLLTLLMAHAQAA